MNLLALDNRRNVVGLIAAAVLCIMAVILFLSAAHSEQRKELTVLMYHRVESPSAASARYQLTAADLASHIRQLRAQGYNVLSPSELSDFVAGIQDFGSNPVILTFDDGTAGHYQYAYPVLQRLDAAAIFFVVSDWVNDDGMMTFTELRNMQQGGMVIGSHSQTHPYAPSLRELPDTAIERELRHSRRVLGDSLDGPPRVFSVPGGWYDERTLRWADSLGYRWVFTSDIGKNTLPRKDMVLRRLEVTGETGPGELTDELLSPRRIVLARLIQRSKKLGYSVVGPQIYRNLGDYKVVVLLGLSIVSLLVVIMARGVLLKLVRSTDGRPS